MKIGNFTKTKDGHFEGRIQTLSVNLDIRFVPVADKPKANAPDFRIMSGDQAVEYGAAWHDTSEAGNPYISGKLDDPLASRPVYTALTREDDGYGLFWSRPKSGKKKSGAKETL